jgi:putative membrane protein
MKTASGINLIQIVQSQIVFMKRISLLLCLGTAVLVACNNEGKDPVEQADSANKQARTDTMTMAPAPDAATSSFLVDATNGGMAEVALSRLAMEKTSNESIKHFADLMVSGHTAVNDEIRALAARKNVTLPSDVSEENKKKADDMMKKAGKDFDKEYINVMIKDHEKAIDLFEKATNNLKDAEVISFATNTLPNLRGHLDSIKLIKKNWK